MAMSPASWKIVQRVKEIVDLSEAEIYTTLKDCDMDPDEAVDRLTTQGSFHEVKRKREKKKEVKGNKITFRGSTKNGSSGGIRSGPDRCIGRGSSTHYSSSESSSMHERLTYGNGDGTTGYTSYTPPASDVPGNNKSNGPYGHSNGVFAENERPSLGKADSMTSVAQSTPVHQSSLAGVAGQLTMADVVKLGRLHGKISNGHGTHEFSSHGGNIQSFDEDEAHEVPHHGVTSFQHVSANSDWPPLEKPADGDLISVPEYTVDFEMHPEEYAVPYDSANQHYVEEKVQESEEGIAESSETNDAGSDNGSLKKIPQNVSRGASLFENELRRSMGSSQLAYNIEHHGGDSREEEHGESRSVVTKDLQRLSLANDDREFPSDEDEPSVIIPDHLQVQSADCSHLSFGSFQPAKSSTYSLGIETSAAIENGLEDDPGNKDDISLADHANTRPKLDAIDDYASDGNLFYGNVAPEGIYDKDVASWPEEPKQYSFPSLIRNHSFDDSHSAALNQTSSHVQNHALLSNLLQSYTKPVSSSLLAANAQASREPDPTHKSYQTLQSMPAIYENALPVTGGSTISMSEALKVAGIRPTQPSLNNPVTLPQHLDLQSLGPYAEVIDRSLPQSFGYVPSDIKQTLSRNSMRLQSLAARVPQYKDSVSASSLPYDASVLSRRGGFGSATSIHGDYPMDLPTSISGRSLLYDDVSSSRYDDYRQLLSLQQNESSANWLRQHDSSMTPSVMCTSHHNRRRQIPQLGLGQQQSQDYMRPGYNYHFQSGNSLLDHQQYPRGFLDRSSQRQHGHSQMWPQY